MYILLLRDKKYVGRWYENCVCVFKLSEVEKFKVCSESQVHNTRQMSQLELEIVQKK